MEPLWVMFLLLFGLPFVFRKAYAWRWLPSIGGGFGVAFAYLAFFITWTAIKQLGDTDAERAAREEQTQQIHRDLDESLDRLQKESKELWGHLF